MDTLSKNWIRFFKLANGVLFVVTAILGIYIAIGPLWPQASFYIGRLSVFADLGDTPDDTSGDGSSLVLPADSAHTQTVEVVKENTLIIPKIGVSGVVHEGKSDSTLFKGVWRRPQGGVPSTGGNTVFVAHRFLYTSGPNTFYHLDKLTAGDRVVVWWEGIKYEYEVTESKVVAADAFEIEGDTSSSTLTLWTCTPLWTAKDRLMVRAKLVSPFLRL